ncbi:MAG: ferritin-like domain-containing protein [Myxococcota bacterium]|nr:ferritin-like domain-containing protein [Myxococcota bacterium]
MIQCGLPRALVDRAQRIVSDELDHAELAHQCMVDLGGRRDAVELDIASLAMLDDAAGPLASLVDTILHAFCLGETLAVPLFAAMRPHTVQPTAAAALQRLLRDEASHRAFGWDALDALLDIDPCGVRARVKDRLPTALQTFEQAYGKVPDGPPLTRAERAAGLLDGAAYRAAYHHALVDDIGPRLARRGIDLPGGCPPLPLDPLPPPSQPE